MAHRGSGDMSDLSSAMHCITDMGERLPQFRLAFSARGHLALVYAAGCAFLNTQPRQNANATSSIVENRSCSLTVS